MLNYALSLATRFVDMKMTRVFLGLTVDQVLYYRRLLYPDFDELQTARPNGEHKGKSRSLEFRGKDEYMWKRIT
jgi:hypothetical protein